MFEIDKLNYRRIFLNNWVEKASFIVLISAVFKRNQIKYGKRGYRYIMIEAGHLGQNIYLVSNALGLNCCALGGFADNELNKLLDIDGLNESVIYVFAIGGNENK